MYFRSAAGIDMVVEFELKTITMTKRWVGATFTLYFLWPLE
jgi:hypothetical protein